MSHVLHSDTKAREYATKIYYYVRRKNINSDYNNKRELFIHI